MKMLLAAMEGIASCATQCACCRMHASIAHAAVERFRWPNASKPADTGECCAYCHRYPCKCPPIFTLAKDEAAVLAEGPQHHVSSDPVGDMLRALPVVGVINVDDPRDPRHKEWKLDV